MRTAVRLDGHLERLLSAYVLAAGAGFGLTPLADAKIVYTPSDVAIPANGGPVLLDLNHDGIADFSFINNEWTGYEGEFVFLLGAGALNPDNAIRGRGLFNSSFMSFKGLFATALHAGFAVEPNKMYFQRNSKWLLGQNNGWAYSSASSGQWLYTKGRYLGLKFMIGGQTHYGWARLNVSFVQPGLRQYGIYAVVTGYAYETIPNKPIITGKTKGPDVVVMRPDERAAAENNKEASAPFFPPTLGRLAQGASGVPLRRKNAGRWKVTTPR